MYNTENRTRTYINVTRFNLGAGVGAGRFRVLVIFDDREKTEGFRDGSWQSVISAESAVESQCSGRMSKGGEGYRVFYASDTGVALAATARLISKKLSWTAEYNGFTGSRDTFITSINWRF